jgi:hypothetical protein
MRVGRAGICGINEEPAYPNIDWLYDNKRII